MTYVKDSLLKNSPSPLIWKDGSGLSRYNLLTPNSLVYLLGEIKKKVSKEQLYHLFPNGNEEALRVDYKIIGLSLHAKTGTLSNKHCLSGYLECDSGKVLIFSFMHNNYTGSSEPLKKEMSQILQYIKSNY